MINDASLVMIPSGYKDGKLYSVKPTDGSGDFTFSRGSNLAATRVNSEGLIEKGRENLFLQSNQFDTTWQRYLTTLISGQSGYDGSNNAWSLSKSASGFANLYQSVSTSGVLTASVYAKAGTNSTMILRCLGGTDVQGFFNLSNGTIAAPSSNCIDTEINAVGNGWYRCSITFITSSTSSVNIYPEYPFGGTTAGNIYIQDAQLEAGLVATDYIETTTTTAQAGILEDMPRLNYGTCPSLLLEPQRTNLMIQSEGFATTAWTDNKSANTIVNANAAISPEGVQNATEIRFTTTAGAEIYDQFTNVPSSMHIGTMFLKNNGVNFITLELQGSAPSIAAAVTVDLRDGTLSSPNGDYTPTIEDYGNGWWRVAIGDTGTATVASPAYRIKSVGSNTGSFYVYGAMVEAGSYPTSYIPTYGASVTRGEDVCVGGGDSSTFNDSEGVLFFEGSTLVETGEIRVISLSNGSTNNNIYFNFNANANSLNCEIKAGGSTQFNPYVTMTKLNNNKIAVKYKENDFALWLNGVEVATDTSGTTPTGLDRLNFDFGQGSFDFKGNVKQILYFNTALSDSELAALTS